MTLTLRSLSALFPGGRGIRDVDATFAAGRYVALLGGSGSGKTTLLRTIAGLHPATSGTILLDARDVTREAPHLRDAGFVFQGFALFPHLDVGGNVAYGLRMRGVPESERAGRVAEALAVAGLPGAEHRAVGALSGGEQQRVAIARALAPKPRLLLLDEPLANLDAGLKAATREALRALHERLGLTTIHVTHDREEAMAVADDLAVLIDGRLRRFGPCRDVWDDPGDADVARFLGMTLLPVDVSAGRAQAPGFSARIDGEGVRGRTLLGFRPIDLRIAPGTTASVTRRRDLGDAIDVTVTCADTTYRMRAFPGSPEAALRPGDAIALTLREGAGRPFADADVP